MPFHVVGTIIVHYKTAVYIPVGKGKMLNDVWPLAAGPHIILPYGDWQFGKITIIKSNILSYFAYTQ